jgi:hypothetical protein
MSDKKPSVFPNKGKVETSSEELAKIQEYEAQKSAVTNEIYTSAMNEDLNSMSAVEMMRRRTAMQMQQREQEGVVYDPALSEEPKTTARQYTEANKDKNEEQMRLRDEQLAKNIQQTYDYNRMSEEAMARKDEPVKEKINTMTTNNNYIPPTNNGNDFTQDFGKTPSNINPYIIELSQPNYNAPFDVIPLPSLGKAYKSKKKNIKLAYMTTADENILTSPNLLQSGEFLEILINRKILEPDLRYKDLLVGDRNAIMLWLRATGYGEMYPVTLLDENEDPFDTEINLNELKTKELTVDPDEDGLFNFILPLTKTHVRFRFLTCGDIDDIEKVLEKERENNVPINNGTTYRYERMIVEVNGDRNKANIRNFVNSMRIPDAKAFDNYVEEIESGIDLNIDVKTPGDGSISTFLPLNLNFFWPDIRL